MSNVNKFNSLDIVPDGKFIVKNKDGTFTINSGLPEFGYELLATIPLAWSLYQRGLLNATLSGVDTAPLYWFSPDHKEIGGKRSFENVKKLQNAGFPNMDIHRKQLDWQYFSPPDFKEYYNDKSILFDKPTVIISNRINEEWSGPAINYLTAENLNKIFEILNEKYQIVYIETTQFGVEYEDHSKFQSESECMKGLNLKGVITLSDLSKNYPNLSLNEIQCRLYSGCERFVSSNGGLGILASYFGGENIIFTKKCHEVNPDINSFYGWYPRLSGATISLARDESKLIEIIYDKWVKCSPLFNIIIRTSGRPNYFHDCISSVLDQNYSNVNIIVGFDSPDSEEYICKHPCMRIPLEPWNKDIPRRPEGDNYGIWFPFNSYFNKLIKYANKGYVIYLDDDDKFFDCQALLKLSRTISESNADSIFWRVQFPNRLVPGDLSWSKKKPVCKDVSTIGFLHSVNIKPTWEPWKRGDYRVAEWVCQKAGTLIWLDDVLTGLQRVEEDGYGVRDDKKFIDPTLNKEIIVIIAAYDADEYLENCLDSILLQRSNLHILVGVDGCSKTTKIIKHRLAKKYGSKVQFWRSEENVGPYLVKNALLKKIQRRNSLIVTFDSDDLMPANFLSQCLDLYHNNKRDDNNTCGLQLNLIDFSAPIFFNQSSQNIFEKNILTKVLKYGSNSFYGNLAEHVAAFHSMKERYISTQSSFRLNLRSSHGVILVEFSALESVGFYNPERVGMDSNLLDRLKFKGYKLKKYSGSPWFVRRVHLSSLTQSSVTGLNSDYRKKIKAKYQRLLSDGIFKSEGHSVKINMIL